MKLRKPCQHGKYDAHKGWDDGTSICPGGVFLPDDTLIIEKAKGYVWPRWCLEHDAPKFGDEADCVTAYWSGDCEPTVQVLVVPLDALSVREAE